MTSTGCRRCCSYPHGPMSCIGNIFGFFAWFLGWFSMWSCCYVKQTFNDSPDRCFGLYVREDDDYNNIDNYNNDETPSCEEWPRIQIEEFDGRWRAGRSFAAIAQPMGFVTMCILFSSCCVAYHPPVIKFGGIIMFFIGLFKFLELISLGSDICEASAFGGGNSCSFNTGARLSITSGIFWFVTGCITLSLREARPDPDDVVHHTPGGTAETEIPTATATPVATAAIGGGEPGTVTTTELNLPDGTKTTTKTTINADGSRTVTETVEQARAAKTEVM